MSGGNSEFLAWLIGFERAAQIWSRAPQGLKNAVLLEGEALKDAERWYAMHPEAFAEPVKIFLDRCRAHRDTAEQRIREMKGRNRRRRLAWIGDFALVAAVASLLFAVEISMPDTRGLFDPLIERLPHARLAEPERQPPREIAKAPPGPEQPQLLSPTPQRQQVAGPDEPVVSRGRVYQKNLPPPRRASEAEVRIPARAPSPARTEDRRLADARALIETALKEADKGNRETGLLIALDTLEGQPASVMARLDMREVLLRGLREGSDGPSLPFALRPASDLEALAMAPTIAAFATLAPEAVERIAGIVAGMRRESLSLSPDRRVLAIGAGEDEATLVDIASARVLAVLKGHVAAVARTRFSPDGRRVATGAEDETINLHDAPTGRRLHELRGHEGAITALQFSPDGALLLSTAADRTARLWRVSDGRLVAVLSGHQGNVVQAEFSQDGRVLMTVGSDGALRIWQAATGAALVRVEVLNPIVTAALDRAGTHVVAATDEGEILLVSLASAEVLATFPTADDAVRAVVPDAEARRALSLTWAGRLTLVDLATRRVIGELAAGSDAVVSARFDEAGRRIEARTSTGRVLSWPADPTWEALAARARASVTRCLTIGEREALGLDHPPPRWCATMPRREASLTP